MIVDFRFEIIKSWIIHYYIGDVDMSIEKSLYDQLKLKKENGEQLDFKKITYDELYKLWRTEGKSDAMIGEIYNVTKGAVRKKRDRMDMKMYDIEL
jgi:hypothetical protein